jgi:sulfonate transport system permease protein
VTVPSVDGTAVHPAPSGSGGTRRPTAERSWPARVAAVFMARPLQSLGGLVLFFALWELASHTGLIRRTVFPPPSAVPDAFWGEFTEGIWLETVQASLSHYALGLLAGSLLGCLVGSLAGLMPRLETAQAWVVRVLRPIPGIAWIPFAILWFGVSESAAIFIIGIAVFWINYFAALGAVQSVDKDLIEVALAFGHRSLGARLFKVLLPAATPGILAGVRTGIGQAWTSVLAAELFGIDGIGQRMMQASGLLNGQIVLVYMLTMAALYGAIDMLFVSFQNWVLRWRR